MEPKGSYSRLMTPVFLRKNEETNIVPILKHGHTKRSELFVRGRGAKGLKNYNLNKSGI